MAQTSVRDCVRHLGIQIVAVKVQNPSKCLLKLLECSLCPDQNKTWWQVPVHDIPLFISESPQFPPTEREKTERERRRERERRGPEVCLGGRWLSVAVNRQLFDAIVLAQACLSHSVTAIKESLTAETGARVETRGNPHILSFTPGIQTLWNLGLWIMMELIILTWPWRKKNMNWWLKWNGSPVSALPMIIGKCLEKYFDWDCVLYGSFLYQLLKCFWLHGATILIVLLLNT